jgi:ATP-binding cassette subfamily F protein 3
VINDFDGTVILVSHDRYLVSRLATQIWTLEGDRLNVHKGPYHEYIAAREREAAEEAEAAQNRRVSARRQARESPEELRAREARRAAKRAADLEASIHHLEAQLASLSTELAAASQRQAFDQFRQLALQYSSVESELERTLTEWTSVASSTHDGEQDSHRPDR